MPSAKPIKFSSLHPRPLGQWDASARTSQSLNYLQQESSNYTGYVRRALPDTAATTLLSSCDPSRVLCCQLTLNPQQPTWQFVQLPTSAIYRDPTILPYLLPDELPKQLREQLARYIRVLQQYPKQPRPRLYRVRHNFYVDELGRQYFVSATAGQLKFGGRTSFGDGRSERVITDYRYPSKISVKLALYSWNGLAGLSSASQARILVSKGFDFHHVDENLFDIRPSAIYPIPSFLHRYVHSEVPSYDDLVKFFT